MRILIAAGVPKRREGGVAGIVYNLGRELEALGHQVSYILIDDLVRQGSVSPRFQELIFSYRLARYIVQNSQQFSVVNLHAPAGFMYGLYRKLHRRADLPPYVMTLHGLEERRVHAMRREAKKRRAWNFAWKNRLWHRLYHFPRFRWSIHTASGAHAVCRDVWAMLQLKYNLDTERVAYIPSGVEQRFLVCRHYQTKDTLRLLYAGTWLDQRGIFYIRDALNKVAPKIPGLKMTFAGCGVPPEEIKRFFGPELANCIDVCPVVAAERMHELYAAHDVFLFPSLMEALPLVIQEAMASGMPVITTETCGMPDLIRHEVNGLLIPTANARAIEQAILRLAESTELRQKLGEAAQDTMKRFTWERAAVEFAAFCQQVIALDQNHHSH